MINTIDRGNQYYRELKKTDDRCDRCGVAAQYRALKLIDDPLEILFCGHHFRSNSYKLGLDGWLIQSEE